MNSARINRDAKVLRGFPPHIAAMGKMSENGPTFFGIHMEPVCNFRCRKCFIGEQKGLPGSARKLEKEEIFEIMESARSAGAKVFGITGAGEPLLDGKLPDIVSKANNLGFITHIPTNASRLEKEVAEFFKDSNVTLVLSLDSANAKRFAALSGTSEQMFSKVIRNMIAAQEVFGGTMETLEQNGSKMHVFRIALHTTLFDQNASDMGAISSLAGKDTLMSVSPLASAGFAADWPREDAALTEKHVVICNDPGTRNKICGFFRFGIDMNFDGQLLLDAHAIESRGMLGNIRDFGLDVGRAFGHLAEIKREFIASHLEGFCPVRSSGFAGWIAKRKPAIADRAGREEVLESVRNGEPTLKFSYTNSGVENFINVLDSPEYHTSRNEERIIDVNLKSLASLLKKRVVVLGVGDGRKLVKLLKNAADVAFVDISPELLEIACKKTGIRAKQIKSSFEDVDFAQFGNDTTFIMLGGSLWNMAGWTAFLRKISDECHGANFIAGLEFSGSQSQEKIVAEYENENGFGFIFHPMERLGLLRSDGDMMVKFNGEMARVEEFFVLNDVGRKKMALLGIENVQHALLSVSIKLAGFGEMERALSGTAIRMGGFDASEGQNHIIELLL